MKYYSDMINEECKTKDMWVDELYLSGKESILLMEQKRDIGSGYFFCLIEHECYGVGDGDCGRSCENYQPRNGKSGRCRYSVNTLTDTGRKFVLNKTGKMTPFEEAEQEDK